MDNTMWAVYWGTRTGGRGLGQIWDNYADAAASAKGLAAEEPGTETYVVSIKPVARFKARPAEVYEEAL